MALGPSREVERYLDALPEERRRVAREVVAEIRRALPDGYGESTSGGMPTWEVPLARYPETYNGKPLMYLAFAAQKRHFALYLTAPYQDAELLERLRQGFAAAGKRLDMGKSCLRFRSLDDLPLPVIREIVAARDVDAFVEAYERARR